MRSQRLVIFLAITALIAALVLAVGIYMGGRLERADAGAMKAFLLAAFGVATVLAWLVAGALAHPVAWISARARQMAAALQDGDLSARVGGRAPEPVAEAVAAVNEAVAHLATRTSTAEAEGRRYATILEHVPDAVVAVDEHGRVQYVNASFARLFEVTPAEAVGRPLENVSLHYEVSALVSRAVQQGTVQVGVVRLAHPRERILEGVCIPLTDDAHTVVGAVGLLRDITSVRAAQQARQDFVANASHELRTPAAAIKALAEALQAGAMSDPQHGPKFLEQIVGAADRLTGILDDMLTLTRVERGGKRLEPQELDARAAMEDALAQVAPAARAKRVEISADAHAGDHVFADPESLHTLLVNLLDNAVKYTPEGGRVSLRGRRVPAGYELEVTDTGVGIAREHLDRIFQRFYRVDRARDRATGSTGLGLAIVKHIAEAHGGRVTVQSQPGEGSTFTAFLPTPEDEATAR
ncbi:MAG: ATP-binding protein [Armatimonadota bacterium]